MADENIVKPEDVENAEKIKQALEDTAKTKEKLLDLTLKQEGVEKSISELLKLELGKQAEFITQAELEADLLRRSLDILSERYELSLTAEQDVNILKEKQKSIQEEINDLSEDTTGKASELENELKKVNRELEKKESKFKSITKEQGKSTEELKKELIAQRDTLKLATARADKQKDLKDLVTTQLAETLGIKDVTSDLTDELINTVIEAESLGQATRDFADALQSASKVKLSTALKSAKGLLQDFGTDFLGRVSQIAERLQDIPTAFVQQTGRARRFGEELKNITVPLNQQGFLLDEINAAQATLIDNFNKFTDVSAVQRAELIKDAAILNRVGVNTATFAESIENLTTGMGMNTRQASDLTKEIVNFGRELGISANQSLEQLNRNFDILATFGREKGVEIFKGLATTARRAGIEMSELIQIGKQFDTFDSAMRSAGKLNFILGGPLINSMQMLNATEEERIDVLKRSLEQSGKSFDDLGRRGREALASTLGISVTVAERLFNDKNIKSIKDATAAVDANKKSLEELAKEGMENLTLEQRRTLAAERSITSQETLLKTVGELKNVFVGLQETLSNVVGVLGVIGVAFNAINAGVSLFGVVSSGAAVGAGVLSKALMGLGGITAIAAAAYGLYEYFSDDEPAPPTVGPQAFDESILNNVPAAAIGVDSASGGMTLVGEQGPELANIPAGTQITSAVKTQQMMATLDTFNSIASTGTASPETLSNTVAATSANSMEDLNLNLVIKMDEREVARVAQKVSMETMRKGLEIKA